MYRVSAHLGHFALALLAGAALGTVFATLAPGDYYDLIERRLGGLGWLRGLGLTGLQAPLNAPLTPIWIVGQVLMAPFGFVIAKELWEAHRLERGPLRGRRGALPLAATLGGMMGAGAVWLVISALIVTAEEAHPGAGWAVPLGTEVFVAWLAGRAVFGPGHPALHLLLLIAIGSDLTGLVVMAFSAPDTVLRPLWLALPALAAALVWQSHGRHARIHDTEVAHQRAAKAWPYLLAAAVSWAGVVAAGLPGALGFVPILPVIPHSARAFGIFAEAEALLSDPLNRIARALVWPLALALFAFGFLRGGLDLGAGSAVTLAFLGAVWLGKPLGLLAGAALALRLLGQSLPQGIGQHRIGWGDLVWLACLTGMGFTLPLLAIDAGLPGGAMAEAARLGAGLSLLAAPVLVLAARVLRR